MQWNDIIEHFRDSLLIKKAVNCITYSDSILPQLQTIETQVFIGRNSLYTQTAIFFKVQIQGHKNLAHLPVIIWHYLE